MKKSLLLFYLGFACRKPWYDGRRFSLLHQQLVEGWDEHYYRSALAPAYISYYYSSLDICPDILRNCRKWRKNRRLTTLASVLLRQTSFNPLEVLPSAHHIQSIRPGKRSKRHWLSNEINDLAAGVSISGQAPSERDTFEYHTECNEAALEVASLFCATFLHPNQSS